MKKAVMTAVESINAAVDLHKECLVGRDEVVDIAWLALLARVNLFVIGPPGTAKSMLTKYLGQYLDTGAQNAYFGVQLNKFSTPDTVIGTPILDLYQKGIFTRNIEGRLCDCVFGMIDELDKANGAVLNSLLSILNEREYDNGYGVQKLPLRSIVSTANQYISTDATRGAEAEALQAVWDRFLIRYPLGYLTEERTFSSLVWEEFPSPEDHGPLVTMQDLASFDEGVKKVRSTPAAKEALSELWVKFHDNTEISPVSDRRWRAAARQLVPAHVLMSGRDKIDAKDFLILRHSLWSDPAEREAVAEIIIETVYPGLNEANEALDRVRAAKGEFLSTVQDPNTPTAEVSDKWVQLAHTIREGATQISRSLGVGKDASEYKEKLREMKEEAESAHKERINRERRELDDNASLVDGIDLEMDDEQKSKIGFRP